MGGFGGGDIEFGFIIDFCGMIGGGILLFFVVIKLVMLENDWESNLWGLLKVLIVFFWGMGMGVWDFWDMIFDFDCVVIDVIVDVVFEND